MLDRIKAVSLRVLLVVLSSATALAIGEIAVRTVAPQKTFFPRYVDSPEYPIELPPRAELVHSQGNEWRFVYTTNDLSRRGPYTPPEQMGDRQRVVVLGDSFTFGVGVEDDEVFTRILSDSLGADYGVINGGMGGWGIDSQVKWFYRVGRKYAPDIVILQFTANDPGESWSGVTEIREGDFVFHPYVNRKSGWQIFLSESRLIQTSHLYSLARSAYTEAFEERPRSAWSNPRRGPTNEEAVTASATQVTRPSSPAQSNYNEMLDLFARKLAQEGIELLFVSVTFQRQDPPEYTYDLERFRFIRHKVEELDSLGLLSFVELPLETMARYPGSPEGHQWGPEHHAIVGARLAAAIEETVTERDDQGGAR